MKLSRPFEIKDDGFFAMLVSLALQSQLCKKSVIRVYRGIGSGFFALKKASRNMPRVFLSKKFVPNSSQHLAGT
jgi:hypothetical protein